jgi:hypothetical protein
MSAPRYIPVESDRSELGAEHSTHQRSLSLKQLSDVFSAGTTSGQRVPAVGALAARGFAATDLELLTVVQRSLKNTLDTLFAQLTVYPNAELGRHCTHRALQLCSQIAIRGD